MRLVTIAQITATGSAQAVSATQLNVEAVIFNVESTNAGALYIGDSNVSSTRFAKKLVAGAEGSWQMAVNVSDQADSSYIALNSIYVLGTASDKVNVAYLIRE